MREEIVAARARNCDSEVKDCVGDGGRCEILR